jgi:hypothetical protein
MQGGPVSDRQQEVLNAIDLAVAQCICGNEVPPDGASLDYCSPACQYGYSGPRDTYRLGHGLPDGRTLNEQVARELERSEPIGEHYADAMRAEATPEIDLTSQIRSVTVSTSGLTEATQRLADAFTRLGAEATEYVWEDEPGLGRIGGYEIRDGIDGPVVASSSQEEAEDANVTTELAANVQRATGIPDELGRPFSWSEHVRAWEAMMVSRGRIYDQLMSDRVGAELRAIVPDDDRRAAYLAVAEGRVRLAVTLAQTGATPEHLQELRDRGVPDYHLHEVSQFEPQRALDISRCMDDINRNGFSIPAATLDSLMRRQPEPQPTGEEFRRRALEHQQNRGTGPDRRDNRRWRNR